MNDITLLILLLTAGMLLVGAEIFVPGAVLGTLGGLSLFGAVIVAFNISLQWGFYTSFGILILTVVSVFMWVKLFPKSSVGKKMTLSEDGTAFKSGASRMDLLGKTGIVSAELRPAGFAMIEGHRIDVIAEGGIIDKDQPVVVIKVEGNRVIVRKVGT